MYKELVKYANEQENKKLPIQIDWILDEFANCPPLNDIESVVSVARSMGMRFNFFIQSFAQLNRVYGKDTAQIILDNCGLIFLKTNTQETADEISKRLGKKTIRIQSISQSNSSSYYSNGLNTNLKERELLTSDEIKQLHYKTIIFPTVGHPIFRDTVLYNKFKCYQSGFINRNTSQINNLKETYFTVEQLVNNKKKPNEKELEKDKDKEFLENIEEVILNDKKKLYSLKEDLKNVIKSKDYVFKYIQTENNRLFLRFIFDKETTTMEKHKILAKVDKNKYHVVYLVKDNKTEMEVHNISLF